MELKYLDLFKCYRILTDCGGHPMGGVADGWMGVGVGTSVWEMSYACTHAHACAHTHVHTHTHARTCMLNMINMDASMLVAICNFYTCIHVYVCVCMHAHACVCMWGHLPMPPRCPQTAPPTHLPPPQSRRKPKTPNFNNSWTNQDNSILFKDSLPLNIPELI